MNDLAWLSKLRFQQALRHEYSWTFDFDQGVRIKAECLWRLVVDGRIQRTSRDDGHQFGLPAPVDAVSELNQQLSGALVNSVELHEGTLDLEIRFDSTCTLQIIPDSSGYEAWAVYSSDAEFIAVGGGNLATFRASEGR